jgi:hypothetical protein
MGTEDPPPAGPPGRQALLDERRLALGFERLRYDRQKMATEVRLRRRELKAPAGKAWKEIVANPLALAVVGGFLTLMTTTIGSSINTSNNIAAEAAKARQALQAELIKKFVESPDPATVRTNLAFLSDVGLLPDYAERIRAYLVANPDSAPTASPTGLQAVRTDDDAIDLVISFEGGYVGASDPIWATKFGINLAQLTNYLGREASKQELRDMDIVVARDIYRKLYLQSVSSINSIAVKATYLSMAVSMGTARAMQITQTAIGKASGKQIYADGRLAPVTVSLVNTLDADLLVETMACEWARYYRSLPNFNVFGTAWLKRVRTYLPTNPKGLCPDVLAAAVGTPTP